MDKKLIPIYDGNLTDSIYDIEEKLLSDKEYNKEITLKYSHMGRWTRPGEKGYSLTNTGNGFIFKDHFSEEMYPIDYCQMEALMALIKLHKEESKFMIMENIDEI